MQIFPRFFLQSTIALLLVGLVALIGIVGATFWLGERAQVYFSDVIAARDARSAAVELRSAMQTAESSQRGYLLTGNEIYLAPYGTAKTQAERQLAKVTDGLGTTSSAKPALERLTGLIAEKFAEMDSSIALKRDRRDAEALASIRTNQGKALTDEANVFFAGLIRAADERLTTGVSEQKANAAWLRLVSIVGGLIIIGVVGGAGVAVGRYTRELKQARDEVGRLNAGLERRVSERTADLERANDEIQRFAYIVTHDLRAPLVNIMGFTSELEGSVGSLAALIEKGGAALDPADPVLRAARLAATEDIPEAIGFIRTSTRKMDNLINAILKLSRGGRRALRPEPVRLDEVLGASVAAIQHQLGEAKGEVELRLNVPHIVSDKLSLDLILGNLLDNAVKYRSPERPLRIAISADIVSETQIVVEIADNGRGIAEQDKERVFELFRRSGAQDQPGEGIGLAYVRTLVRNLGGEISLASTLDQGTTFRVSLPRTLAIEGHHP